MANLIVPNGKLAPDLVKRGIKMDRDYRASVDMALFNMEHPLVGGYAPTKLHCVAPLVSRTTCQTRSGSCARGSRFHRSRRCRPLLTATTPTSRAKWASTTRRRAKALLDAFGYIDRDGDGWRELPDGTPMTLEVATEPDQWLGNVTKSGARA